jgi:regulator of replication initiation timing
LEEDLEYADIVIRENSDFINFLFSNKILIPISEDFLRYHKDNEKYDLNDNVKNRDDTKIKYIINKINNIKNYYSPMVEKNAKLKLDTEKLFYKQLDPRMAILFNDNEEIKIIQKLELLENVTDYDLLIELENIRKYAYVNFKNVSRDYIKLRTSNTIDSIRYTSLKLKKNIPIETRIGHNNLDLNVIGVAWNPSRFKLNKTPTINTPLDLLLKYFKSQ